MSEPPAVVVERVIKARPDTVFTFFTDPERWRRWQGFEAILDPRPGGVLRINVYGGDGWASGRFVEVDPPSRLVFTWGWEMPGNPVPPGSSTVAVDLLPHPSGTLIRLTHTGLPVDLLGRTTEGWQRYLPRLAAAAQELPPAT